MSERHDACASCSLFGLDHPCETAGRLDPARVARAFLELYRFTYGTSPDPAAAEARQWAYNCIEALRYTDPDLALDVVLLALGMTGEDDEIAFLAAGPMEDLIVDAGEQVIGRVEAEAMRNPGFRRLLSGIWSQGTSGTEVWRRVQRAVQDGPWLSDDPRTPQGTARLTRKH